MLTVLSGNFKMFYNRHRRAKAFKMENYFAAYNNNK